ncbi:MAG: NADH-quinone oxidoreductase subunit L [Magnetococcales bacterium]|nr:NADH-quinone oxidoreductase subunit L [Magnetococcales bacterium]
MTSNEIYWGAVSSFPLLGTMQLLPALGACFLWFLKRPLPALLLALAVAGGEFYLATLLHNLLNTANPSLQLAEKVVLLAPLVYHAGADGFTVLFILLTAFLTIMVMLYGWVRDLERMPQFLAMVLAMETVVISQVATVDLLWFSLMSLLQIGLGGGLLHEWATSPEEGPARTRYYQFLMVGWLLLIGATYLLGWEYADTTPDRRWSFDLVNLLDHSVPTGRQSVLFFLLFYGLAIRIPAFPLHGWLPGVAEHGTVAPALVFLIGVKTGVYGILRFLIPLFPDEVWQWHTFVVAFASAGTFHAALLALEQQNMRRLLAYAVVSHTSVMLIGIFSLHASSFQGGVLLAANFGLAVATLLFMAGLIFKHAHTLLLHKLGGLFDRQPLVGIGFLVASIAIVGMPGTPGFDAAHLVLEGAIDRFGALVTIMAAVGNVAAAACLLWAFQRAFLASPGPQSVTGSLVRRIGVVEGTIAILMVAVQLYAGFFSDPWMRLVEAPSKALAHSFSRLEVLP